MLITGNTNMRDGGRAFVLMLMVALISGCMASKLNPAENLLGRWHSNIGGFEIMLEYAETTVKIGSGEAVAYQLDGNQLSFAQGDSQVRVISFNGPNEMIQEDPLTGTRHILTRIQP